MSTMNNDYTTDHTPRLTQAEFNALARELRQVGAQSPRGRAARNAIVEANGGLVYKTALYYARQTDTPLDDCMQEGMIGLMTAAERYDPDKGWAFATYAMWWIRQAILSAIRAHGRLIHVPAHIQEAEQRVTAGRARGDDLALVREVPATPLSLDQAPETHLPSGGEKPATLGEIVASPDEQDGSDLAERVATRVDAQAALAVMRQVLTPREYTVLTSRILGSEPLESLARSLGVVRERVR